jgi:hypothetical protein
MIMEPSNDLLGKDDILGMDDIPVEEVIVPEWKGRKVLVSGLTAAGKNAYQASLVEIQGKNRKLKLEHSTAKLLVRTLVDAKRQPLFTETDIIRLGTKSAAVLERLGKIASRLSGMDEQENEDILKNSDAAQSSDLPTVSL